jgi:alkylhydroperoxidase/carboxymuconolactone decarboxylase family protein YurZ
MLDAAEADAGNGTNADERSLWDPHCSGDWATLASVVCGSGILDAKTVELIGIALNAAATHLHAPALRRHVQAAIEAGASRAEILEVLKVASVIGIHSCAFAVPILAAELAAREHGTR